MDGSTWEGSCNNLVAGFGEENYEIFGTGRGKELDVRGKEDNKVLDLRGRREEQV